MSRSRKARALWQGAAPCRQTQRWLAMTGGARNYRRICSAGGSENRSAGTLWHLVRAELRHRPCTLCFPCRFLFHKQDSWSSQCKHERRWFLDWLVTVGTLGA